MQNTISHAELYVPLTCRVKLEHAHVAEPISRQKSDLAVMHQEIGRGGVYLLQVLAEGEELVRVLLCMSAYHFCQTDTRPGYISPGT